MNKVIDFQAATARQPKIRYMITIDEDETPAYVSRELKPGVITIMITARTPKEAEALRKEGAAIEKQAQRNPVAGGAAR